MVAEAAEMPGAPLVRLAGLSKTFPGQHALNDVDIEIRAGEIHALVGENGSGKSTLIKILSGYHRPDPGARAWVRGEPAEFADLSDVAPIRTVHQDLAIIPGLSAVDNVGLGAGFSSDATGRVKWREQAELTRTLLARVTPETVDLFQPMAKAPRLHVTAVAIARVLDGWQDRGLLIFDEPTSALPNEEIERLMNILRDLRDRGSSILLVSHALDEVLDVAERVTVLRNGRHVRTVDVPRISEQELVALMLGDRELPEHPAPAPATAERQLDRGVAIAAKGLCGVECDEIDLEVAPGEVVGVTGLLGSGHLELAYLLTGSAKADSGEVTIGGRTLPAKALTPSLAKKLGLGFVPADRVKEGLIGRSTIAENITLPRLRSFQRRGRLRASAIAHDARERVERAGVRPAEPDLRVEVLSGGNKQKVLLAKALANTSNALIIAEPTVGVDIGAKMDFYRQIRQQAREEGIGILVCSTDLTDLAAVCDRVLAMRFGRFAGEFTGQAINEHAMLAAITGTDAARVAS